MASTSRVTKADLRLFLQQLQSNPDDVRRWSAPLRFSLVRGGLVDLTIYGRRVASAPRFVLMAVFPKVLEFIAKHPNAPAVNFSFDVSIARTQATKGQTKFVFEHKKMSDVQIKIHEAAVVAIAQWLTALCTLRPIALAGASLPVQTCIRFICANTLGAEEYVQHLTDKFITQAGKLALSPPQVSELVKSCRGLDDKLLIGLAAKLVEMKMNNQIGGKQVDAFLRLEGNALLKEKIEKLEGDMGLKIKSEKTIAVNIEKTAAVKTGYQKAKPRVFGNRDDVKIETDIVELDADGWQVLPGIETGGTVRKKQKVTHGKDDGEREVMEID